MSVQFLNTVFYEFYTIFGALFRDFFVTFSLLKVTLRKHRVLRTPHAKSRFLGSQASYTTPKVNPEQGVKTDPEKVLNKSAFGVNF